MSLVCSRVDLSYLRCHRCEFKKVHLTHQHIAAMEHVVRNDMVGWRIAYEGWGHGHIQETPQSGAFINGNGALRALVDHLGFDASSPTESSDEESDFTPSQPKSRRSRCRWIVCWTDHPRDRRR